MCISEIRYQNIRLLQDAVLPLSRVTLLLGPNNSGKSTALKALELAAQGKQLPSSWRTAWAGPKRIPQIEVHGGGPFDGACLRAQWPAGGIQRQAPAAFGAALGTFRLFDFLPRSIGAPANLTPKACLGPDGGMLAVVLDRLRDEEPERFEALNEELGRWFPEFDRILFETPREGMRGLVLRTREGGHRYPARDLSDGTLLGLALLTLVHLPEPPAVLGLEEPDRNIHPRLLERVRDAIYRLAYPEQCGEQRDPVQVIATTHSPLFLDCFRDHPEEVVVAERMAEGVQFRRLSEHPQIDEILGEISLGEAWTSGILGGVPPLI